MAEAAAQPLSRWQLWSRLLLYPGHTLPTAAAPVLVGTGLAWRDGVFAPGPLTLFMLSTWLLHVAGVFADNHTLIKRHPSLPEHPQLLAALAQRRLALSTLAAAIGLTLALATVGGLVLLWLCGPWVLAMSLVGLLASLGYHWGPWPYARRGLADPIFFAMFGSIAVAATYFVQAAALQPVGSWWQHSASVPLEAWWVGLPMGALVTCVLVIDDIRDRHWDAQKGWRTGAVRWGLRWSRAEFGVLMLLAYLAPPAMVALGWGAWMLLPLLTAPLAWRILQAVRRRDGTQALLPWTPRAAMLSLAYAALLALGLALAPG